jgi:hypothetical protein
MSCEDPLDIMNAYLTGDFVPSPTPDEDWERLVGSMSVDIVELRDLIVHSWLHSGYHDCGYVYMTTAQKKLYDTILGRISPNVEDEVTRHEKARARIGQAI